MRRYLLKTIAFLLVFSLVTAGFFGLSALPALSYPIGVLTDSAGFTNELTAVVDRALAMATEKPDANTLVIGDSVMNSLFKTLWNDNPHYCICEGDAYFLMAGQYVLVNEYLNTHPNAEKIILIMRPPTLYEHINSTSSYQYIALPYANEAYGHYLSESTYDTLRKTFGSASLSQPFLGLYKNSYLTRKIFLNKVNDIAPHSYVDFYQMQASDMSLEYLQKMVALCDERGVELVLLAAPMQDKLELWDTAALRQQLQDAGLLQRMPYYFESLLYYPAEAFRDEIHFVDEDLYRADVIANYTRVSGEFADLNYRPKEESA